MPGGECLRLCNIIIIYYVIFSLLYFILPGDMGCVSHRNNKIYCIMHRQQDVFFERKSFFVENMHTHVLSVNEFRSNSV